MQYLVTVEESTSNYAAFSPDLPGCVATGKAREETLRHMGEAIDVHLEGLKEDGLPIPRASASAEYVSV